MSLFAFAHVQTPLRDAITQAYRLDEKTAVAQMVREAAMSAEQIEAAQTLARRLITDVRKKRQASSGVDALMQEFALDSEEGVALMCLAEALLRIPDRATAQQLIRDKLAHGDWAQHLGHSPSLFVNAATWGLLITGKLTASYYEKGLIAALNRVLAQCGQPLILKAMDMAMRLLGDQFVTGETIDKALKNAIEREKKGYQFSYDMLGEAAMTAADAQRYLNDYTQAIHAIGQQSQGKGIQEGPGLSVKLSAIHPRYQRSQHGRIMDELYPKLKSLFLLAKQYNIGLNIDAEEADRLELSLDLIDALAHDTDLAGFEGLGVVVQAYQKRCPFVIDYLIDLARRTNRPMMIRLVKGAYWDSEIKRAQVDGLSGYPVYTQKVYTDVSYFACAKKLLAAQDVIYPQFATHNAYTLAAIYFLAGQKSYEFQCLHGMGETLYDQVVGADQLQRSCRIYAPVGSHETLLAYLVRRLLENGANSSFVNQMVDPNITIDTLIQNPIEQAEALSGAPHPMIGLPAHLFAANPNERGRLNSQGFDLSNELALARLEKGLKEAEQRSWQAMPIVAKARMDDLSFQSVANPANHQHIIGQVAFADEDMVDLAIQNAAHFAPRWASIPPKQRAQYILNIAANLETHFDDLVYLAVLEAGKTLANAIGEIREAVDFCRYYAEQIEHDWSNETHHALGPVVCISPWNFPLAIFLGQITAALAAGNVVLAKPAEQTSLMAHYAVTLVHKAGIPMEALQLLPGIGEVVGAALTQDPRIQGVQFTGSTTVAKHISRVLARRHDGQDIPFIAETGGQNAMIVDSSALSEQVVGDILASAFDSAGQRCSALRVLFLQEDIADKTIAMLKGAMAELCVGSPHHLSVDVGPVIDAEAKTQLMKHIESMKQTALSFYQTPPSADTTMGYFIQPTLFELSNLTQLKQEVFGPVLHVIRFKRDDLSTVIAAINQTGFGLTHGIHSRINETIQYIVSHIKAGNVYVNRNTVGAVVGVQPFGGEGQSGTGPKAGGPLYLSRLSHTVAPASIAAPSLNIPPVLNAFYNYLKEHHAAILATLPHTLWQKPSLLSQTWQFKAYTGETNTMHLAPKGLVACIATTNFGLAQQIIACLLTGNTSVIDSSSPLTLLLALGKEQTLINLQYCHAPLQQEGLAAVLFEGSDLAAATIRQQLVDAHPSIVPCIASSTSDYPLHRLVVERALSINTTAAGGNASLMAMV
jgi:RHH-type proline utilization regulon transcriptional repressor/proline dehydrogenase/delta 1-pyrroline-5-carboxylate dehydrogenase